MSSSKLPSDQYGCHSRVSAMISLVLIATSPRPREWATGRAPAVFGPGFGPNDPHDLAIELELDFRAAAGPPARGFVSGIVTCPLDVMRMAVLTETWSKKSRSRRPPVKLPAAAKMWNMAE